MAIISGPALSDGSLLVSLSSPESAVRAVSSLFGMTLFVMVFSYLFGGLQAGLTGLTLALLCDRRGRFSYLLALLAPIAPGIAGARIFAARSPGFALWLIALGIAASLILRFLFRKAFGRQVLEL